MLARVLSAAVTGIEAVLVSVEVDVSPGLPAFNMVGLPDSTIRESRDRVRSAIRNAGYTFPMERITVSLAPADLRKEGAAFDLPIALGILAATGLVKSEALQRFLLIGELSLDGQVQAVRGVLPIALADRAPLGAQGDGSGTLALGQPRQLVMFNDLKKHEAPAEGEEGAGEEGGQDEGPRSEGSARRFDHVGVIACPVFVTSPDWRPRGEERFLPRRSERRGSTRARHVLARQPHLIARRGKHAQLAPGL